MAHAPVDPNSTYTATFAFEKAMLGAYAGRWQSLVNDNLDLIDAAIAGKAAANHLHAGTYEPAIATLAVAKGGTGTGTAPTSGQVLVGTSGGIYAPPARADLDAITEAENRRDAEVKTALSRLALALLRIEDKLDDLTAETRARELRTDYPHEATDTDDRFV